ncbi:hypothetical protein ACIO93_13805 [Streptomyces sp. NPDC087903]|uniref:hypothetical protein n=1 Tax=Streptomyces sp. NPDC087903 TaxID=3365819 RepID=UPI00381BC023
MLFLIVALIMLAFVLGSVAYLPWPVTLAVSAVIIVWLSVFAVRERRRRSAAGRS